jgi:hypothetical protein
MQGVLLLTEDSTGVTSSGSSDKSSSSSDSQGEAPPKQPSRLFVRAKARANVPHPPPPKAFEPGAQLCSSALLSNYGNTSAKYM